MLSNNFAKYAFLFLLLLLLQVTVFNRISFLGYGVPFIYIYFIIKLPIDISKNVTLILAFLLGFIIDIFCNTPGINAAATTIAAAFVCKPIQNLFFMVDDVKGESPTLSGLGFGFMKYAVFITFIHHVMLISIESFSYINIRIILFRIVSSTILTSILIFAFEGLSLKKKKTWQKTT